MHTTEYIRKLASRHVKSDSKNLRGWLLTTLVSLLTCGTLLAAQSQQSESTQSQQALEGIRTEAQSLGSAISTSDTSKAVQNPLSSLTMVMLQDTVDFNVGSYVRTTNTLHLHPMIPTRASANWILSTWIHVPLAYQPDVKTTRSGVVGLGDIQPTFLLSPVATGKLIWGVGPTLLLPTATNSLLRTGKFSVGPAVLVLAQPGKWTIGAMVNNLFSVWGPSNRKDVNLLSLSYFVNYNLRNGWYLTSAPALIADWTQPPGGVWTVPFGGGVGRIVKLGPQLVNATVASYVNVIHDSQAARWQLFFQLALLYPKGPK